MKERKKLKNCLKRISGIDNRNMGKKKIIIFGATGNVGSYLTLYALDFFNKDEYEVIASGRRKTDFWSRQGVPYYPVDLTKEEDFEVLPKDDV